MNELGKVVDKEILSRSLESKALENIKKIESKKLSDAEKKKIEATSRDFESFFTYMIFKGLRKAMLSDVENEEESNDFGGDIFNDLALMELSRQLSRSRSGIGIAEKIYLHLTGERLNMLPKEIIIPEKNKIKSKEAELSKPANLSDNKPTKLVKGVSKQVAQKIKELEDIIEQTANKYQIPKALIQSVIAVESGGNSYAVSPKGAKGLMQLIDSTAKYVGVRNVFDPKENIEGGAKYLREMLETFDGNIELALAAYNSGPGNVLKYNWVPPFSETRNYINRVKRYLSIFSSNLIGEQ